MEARVSTNSSAFRLAKRKVEDSEVRQKVLKDFFTGSKTTTEIATKESLHISHVSRAIDEMRDLQLVELERQEGRVRYYKATNMGIAIAAALVKRAT